MNEKIEVLITANEYLNNLEQGIDQLVEAFEKEDYNKGCSIISLVAEGIGWITDVINLTKDIHVETIEINEIDKKLEEIVEAIENEDYVLIGDLFKYEISPIIKNIHQQVGKLVAN